MYILLNWNLRSIPKIGIIAEGNVINNPKFYSGQNIYTSKIERVTIDNENKQFIFTTHSENNYIAKFEEINIKLIKEIGNNFDLINIPNEYLDICKSAHKDKADRLKKYLLDILNPNELYIEMVGVAFKKAFFMINKKDIKEIPITRHIGTFQDSVLITDSYEGVIDIRFWDINHNTIKPYSWNKGLKAIKIYNVGNEIIYESDKKKIVLKPNELIEINYENY